jgi:hypothetical protein
MEIAVHTVVVFLIIVPLYGFVLPVYYVERGVVDGYSVVQSLLGHLGTELPVVQQIRAEGWAFDEVSILIVVFLLVVAAVIFLREAHRRLAMVQPGAVSSRDGRRYRTLPPIVRLQLEQELAELWGITKSDEPVPRLYCFAAAPVMACVLANGSVPAIAVSTGLLELHLKGSPTLTRLILLHEISHILVGDQIRLARYEALLKVLRNVVLNLVWVVSVLSLFWAISEKLKDPGGASAVAYLRAIVNPMAFSYLSLIVMSRYLSLIVMLSELRADLRAAAMDNGIESFVAVFEGESAIRDSGWIGRWKSLCGMRVTHLSPSERLALLRSPHRLLTPKLRYFSFSLTLPVILLLVGSSGFVSSSAETTMAFGLVISAGLTGVVTAINIAVVLVLGTNGVARVKFSRLRLMTIALTLITSNLSLFWNESVVISRADVWITSILDPNFREPWPQSLGHAVALGRELIRPFMQPLLDGRMAIWMLAAYASLAGVSRMRVMWTWAVRGLIVVGILLGTLFERLCVRDWPVFHLNEMLRAEWIDSIVEWTGPLTGFETGLLLVVISFGLQNSLGAGSHRFKASHR